MEKRPIVWIFAASLLGMLLSYLGEGRLFISISFFLIFLFIIICFLRFRKKLLIILPFFILMGFFSMQRSLRPGVLEDRLLQRERTVVSVRGYVKKMQPQGLGMGIVLSRAELIEGLETDDRAEKSRGCENISVYIKDRSWCAGLKIGNEIRVEGTLQLLDEPTNPGQFNQKLYYRSDKIYYRMNADTLLIEEASYDRLRQSLYEFRERLGNVYDSLLGERDSGFLRAMLLGDKSAMEAESKALFQKNGIAHVLAISGMHLTILSGIFMWIFKKAGCYRQTGCILSLIVLFGYGIMTGEGISTMRALIMSGMLTLSVLTGRSYDMPTAAALSAMLLLFKSPLYLTQPGFLLSYGAIFGIAVLYTEYTEQTLSRDERRRPLINSLLFSFFIQIALLPVLLCTYYEIFPMSIILNLLVIPLLPFLFVCGLIGGLLGLFFPAAAFPFLYVTHIIFSVYEGGCRLFMGHGELYLITGKPSLPRILFYILVILAFLFLCRLLKKKITIIFLIFTVALLIPFQGGTPWISFLDVGQGDAVVMGRGKKEVCLIDGGSSSISNVGTYRILPFLKYKGISKIDYWFVSHGDEDHYNGLLELLNKQNIEHIRIKTLVLPKLSFEDEALKELEAAAFSNGTDVFYMEPGDVVRESYELCCIHPGDDYKTGDKNSASMVLYWKYKEVSGILTGDLDIEGETCLLNKGKISDVDFLKAGHHGSKGSSGEEFLEKARPELTIISCGKKNRYGHPHEELIERLEACKSKIVRTYNGAVTIESNGEYLRVKRYGGEKQPLP